MSRWLQPCVAVCVVLLFLSLINMKDVCAAGLMRYKKAESSGAWEVATGCMQAANTICAIPSIPTPQPPLPVLQQDAPGPPTLALCYAPAWQGCCRPSGSPACSAVSQRQIMGLSRAKFKKPWGFTPPILNLQIVVDNILDVGGLQKVSGKQQHSSSVG